MTKSTALNNGKNRETARSAQRRTARSVWAVVLTATALVAVAAGFATRGSGNDAASAEKATFEEAKAQAEAGDADGMRRLGYCYLNGIGVEASEEKAFEWTRKSAEMGDTKARSRWGAVIRSVGASRSIKKRRSRVTVERGTRRAVGKRGRDVLPLR